MARHQQAVAETKLCGEARGSASKKALTLRQQKVMRLVAEGMTNKEIANRLNLSEYTIKNHVHRVMKQLDAENRAEAVEIILARGYSFSSVEYLAER